MDKDEAAHADDAEGTIYEFTNAAEYIKTTCTTEILPSTRMLEAGLRGGAPARRLNWGNWGPCSTDFEFLGGGADTAECSGAANLINAANAGTEYPTTGSCAYGQGTVNTWRGDKYWLYQGCLNHDVCLVKGGPNYPGGCGADCADCWTGGVGGYDGTDGLSTGRGQKDCDGYLAKAAKKCAFEGKKSNGKGKRRCKNSWSESSAVWAIMGNPFYNPNDGWCGV